MSVKIVIALSMLVTLVCAMPQGYGNQGGYGPAPYQPSYGPDNAQYYYAVQNYDPYLYKNANLKFNRYPGGAAYTLNEEGPGSQVNVNVETYRAGQKGY